MKTLLFMLLAILMAPALYAQDKLPLICLPLNQTIHFLSPEPICFVDISSKGMIGDLPLKNVFRIKMRDSTVNFQDAVLTIIGETFIAQYRIEPGGAGGPSEVEIGPADMRPLDISGVGFSVNELKKLALQVFADNRKHRVARASAFGITGKLNQVYTAGDYIFLDLSYHNDSNISYDIEDVRFRIDDKKVTKASNVQSVELKPAFVLFETRSFATRYRNIFVFKKISFPGNKVLSVELSEKQPSGRVLNLNISYKDILRADIISN
ncbi:DUF4138 domain-containing protein [Mucilaginibacter sp. P25]|uniref:DUF4138 domain-containing protein n=1 Tax=Mucilaginibacter sp. P25 TaxID=3423945 RepID=UPI003D7B399E